MSITRKVIVIVILVFVLSALANVVIQQTIIMPSFVALEKVTAVKNAERAFGAIERELDQLTLSVSDWAYWSETYDYVKGRNPSYPDKNLDIGTTLEGMNLNFLGIYDTSGKQVWSQSLDLDSGDAIALGSLTETALPVAHPLLQHNDLESAIKGIITTSHSPLLVVAKPILTNDRRGPIAGTMVMGRFLDHAIIQRIGALTQLPIAVGTIQQPISSRGTAVGGAPRGIRHSDFKLVEAADTWQASSVMSDIFGTPILTLHIDTARDISGQGAMAVTQSLWGLAATGILIMLVLWQLLQHTMLHPISKLTEHALLIGKNDNLQARLDLNRRDEVGILADTFDQMVDHLVETRRRLIAQSYHSGVAEMASGVLHNIGNTITPLSIRLSTLQQELRTVPLADLELAETELADPSTPRDRRADLLQFVVLTGVEMAGLIKTSQQTIEASIQQIGQVLEILADQHRFSRTARVIEPIDMVAIINDVAAGLSPELKDALRIEIKPEVLKIGPVAGSRVALQQVVTNLLINAAESIQSAGSAPGSVTISAEYQDLRGQKMAGFRFADNGAGIDPVHQGRLFERGFSTKKREGSGYGLHWSANTVQALGGKISVENLGHGSGVCIHLLLPPAEDSAQQGTAADEASNGFQN